MAGTGAQITGGLGTPGPAGAFYVGGGGGGCADSTSSDPGGSGGYGGGGAGANGPQSIDAQSGVVNTGGGGGATISMQIHIHLREVVDLVLS